MDITPNQIVGNNHNKLVREVYDYWSIKLWAITTISLSGKFTLTYRTKQRYLSSRFIEAPDLRLIKRPYLGGTYYLTRDTTDKVTSDPKAMGSVWSGFSSIW